MRILNCVWLISSWTKISVSFTILKNKNVILFTWRISFCHNILHPVVAIKKKRRKSICVVLYLPLSSSQMVCASKSFHLAFFEYIRACFLLPIICLVFPRIHATFFLVFNMLQDHLQQDRFHCSGCYVTSDWRISYWYLLCWKVLWPQQQNFISFILHFKINSLLILSCWKFRSKAKEVKLLEMLFPSLWLVAKCYFCKYLNYFGKKSEGYLTFALIFNNTSEYTIRLICFQILVSSMGFRMIR